MKSELAVDRLALRGRPSGEPIMSQHWENALFLHWPVRADVLRPLIPAELEIDLFDGSAWIGITPFHLAHLKFSKLPAIPGLSSFHKMSVRTYVLYRGVPGIWFLSIDVSKTIPALAADVLFKLPNYKADIQFDSNADEYFFRLNRDSRPRIEFFAQWRRGIRLAAPSLHSLAFFLTERYSCFTHDGTKLRQIRIYHAPWILDEAHLLEFGSTAVSGLGIPEPEGTPLIHFSRGAEVQLWSPTDPAW